jgi:Flp pilus assembly pilin Flp
VNNIILSAMAWASSLKATLAQRISEERGQDLVEYGVLIGLIAVVAAAALLAFGGLDFETFRNKINDCITFDPGCAS